MIIPGVEVTVKEGRSREGKVVKMVDTMSYVPSLQLRWNDRELMLWELNESASQNANLSRMSI